MTELTQNHIEILTALQAAGGPAPAASLGVSAQGGALSAHIDHLVSRGFIRRAGKALSLTDLGEAALATQDETPASKPEKPAKPPTKKARLITLLQSDEDGVSLDDLAQALGWLPHTTRAALTGLKKAGHRIDRLPPAGGQRTSRYRLGEVG